MSLPYAEDLNYWKTSSAAPDTWVDKAEALVEQYGGYVVSRAIGRQGGAEAILLELAFGEERFRIVWPSLPSKYGAEDTAFRTAARRQAATMLYHDVKARGLRFKIAGPRAAFFEFLMLPDGRCAGELANPDLLSGVPTLLTAGGER